MVLPLLLLQLLVLLLLLGIDNGTGYQVATDGSQRELSNESGDQSGGDVTLVSAEALVSFLFSWRGGGGGGVCCCGGCCGVGT